MKVKELSNSFKKQIAPIYLVLGSESQLQDQARQIFLQLLPPEELEINFAEFDLEEENLEEVVGEANSMPFLGERRLIFVINPEFLQGGKNTTVVEQDLTLFSEYLKHPQPTTTLVIFAPYEKIDKRKKITKLLQKNSELVDAGKLNSNELTTVLKQQIVAAGFQIEDEALTQLIQRSNSDYSLANSELIKLYTYAAKTHKITINAVKALVPQTLDNNVFDLLDALLHNNLAQAKLCYQQLLLLKNDPIALVALAISQIRLLLQVKILNKRGMSSGKLANYLQIHPYRIKLALQQESRYSLFKLKKALYDLIEMDYYMKTGQGNKEYLFELFMINFTQTYK
ncbi:DNA polymerase III subunit delta [Bombilactobacillus bombi]|uniref:DNA polymerase III subunit delta n=1 Tax=Bombilactobacillus bombi TaxID=1303590 RepID=A0A3R6V913_9LACO|nr:DNA polymerase III subunit delta [Bombilactobacillus bombi]MCO6541368.1 DNA polymerase III subunit delta [Lactobacillus sp.]RHW49936.1 DNA polymerase III subunit delta [Bombilactobacillus bombi]